MERMSRSARARGSAGFTLLEMMIAMSILGFGLLGVGAMQIQALEFGRRARHHTQAATIVQRQLEALNRQPWATLAPTPGWVAPVTVNQIVNDGGSRIELSYQLSWRIANRVVGQTRTIDVRVNWDEARHPGREYALSSIRYNN